VVPQHRATVAITGPATAGGVTVRDQRAVRVAASEDVVSSGCDLRAFLGERRIPSEIHLVAVELLNAGGDLDSVCVDPRTAADSIPRVHGWRVC
jgi:hypothetical protein